MKYANLLAILIVLLVTSITASEDDALRAQSVAQELISCVYNHNASINLDCLQSQSIDPETKKLILNLQSSDENFIIAHTNQAVMSEIQTSSQIEATKKADKKQTWTVNTVFNLLIIKGNVEIRRPMHNQQTIEFTGNPEIPVVTTFTTSVTDGTQIIDHQKIRKKNCRATSNPTESSEKS